MENFGTFKDLLKNELKERGVSFQELSEMTEISPRYLQALMDSDTDNLPPSPYIRGYLEKISKAIGTDFSLLWNYYENDTAIQKSGATDILPKNRFAIKSVKKSGIIITGIVIIILAIFFPSITDFFGKPSLEVSFPQEESIFSETDKITIIGKVGRSQDTILINGTEVTPLEDGTFSKEVPLSEGVNSFEIIAQRFLGQKTTIVRNIFYKTRPFSSPTPSPETSPDETPSVEPTESSGV